MEFTYSALPARVVFGAGRRADVPAELDRLGITRALVITTADQSETCATFAAAIGDRLGAIYPGAVMHTPVQVTEAAMRQAEQMNCDGILAIGGGSVPGGMDHLVAAIVMQAAGEDPTAFNYIGYDAGGEATDQVTTTVGATKKPLP